MRTKQGADRGLNHTRPRCSYRTSAPTAGNLKQSRDYDTAVRTFEVGCRERTAYQHQLTSFAQSPCGGPKEWERQATRPLTHTPGQAGMTVQTKT